VAPGDACEELVKSSRVCGIVRPSALYSSEKFPDPETEGRRARRGQGHTEWPGACRPEDRSTPSLRRLSGRVSRSARERRLRFKRKWPLRRAGIRPTSPFLLQGRSGGCPKEETECAITSEWIGLIRPTPSGLCMRVERRSRPRGLALVGRLGRVACATAVWSSRGRRSASSSSPSSRTRERSWPRLSSWPRRRTGRPHLMRRPVKATAHLVLSEFSRLALAGTKPGNHSAHSAV